MSKKEKERKRRLLEREQLIRRKRRLDEQIKGLRLQGEGDANPKIQNLEAEKAQILRWMMYLDGTGSRSAAPVRTFPNLDGKRSKKKKYPDGPFSGGYSDRGP
ncbi:MAG: hypothetical protein M3P37_05495 [Actinomycetota bacterium]|jgi:hypothetical protein|nr:hypothetical protein [Actinomycetota bacterium]